MHMYMHYTGMDVLQHSNVSAVPETEFGREPTHLGRMYPRDVSQQYKQQSICSASHSSSSRIDNTLCFINFHMQVNICVHTHMYTYTHR